MRRKHPRKFKTWAEYVSHAGRHPVKKVGSRPKRKARVRPKSRPRPRKRRVGSAGVSTNSRTHTDYNRNRVSVRSAKNITVGAVNKHKKAAREKLEQLIGKEAVKHFKTVKVRLKKKIAKKISEYKRDYRKLL